MADTSYTWRSLLRILFKTALLFVAVNIIFALLQPLPLLGQLSVYNVLVPGRARLPYGDQAASNNLSLNSIEAMFASHELSRPKAPDEYRVLVMGDSSVWGILLQPHETLTGYLNAAGYTLDDGRQVKFYNLGYPMMSLTKDLLLLDHALSYQPDMVVWMMTLESFPPEKQLEPPPVQNNPARMQALIQQYDLPLNPNDAQFVQTDFMGETLVGRRRDLADWLRLQLYGFAWATTGIDQAIGDYTPRSNDFEADESWYSYSAETFENGMLLDILTAGHQRVGDLPLLVVNEPIFIADGENSDLRYNFWYPKWAYDAYRARLSAAVTANNRAYLDLWDSIDPAEFTDSPVHLTPAASQQLSDLIGTEVQRLAQ